MICAIENLLRYRVTRNEKFAYEQFSTSNVPPHLRHRDRDANAAPVLFIRQQLWASGAMIP
jgi:hypothetical protein